MKLTKKGQKGEPIANRSPHSNAAKQEALQELAREILRRRRIGDRLKSKVDQATSEQEKLRAEALKALEAGDELAAQLLCSQIKIKRLTVNRGSTLYLLNLRISELLSQKEILLKSLGTDLDLTLGNDLLDQAELDQIVEQIRALDVDLSLWTESLDKTCHTGSNELFDELVAEWTRRRSLGEFSEDVPLPLEEPSPIPQDFVAV